MSIDILAFHDAPFDVAKPTEAELQQGYVAPGAKAILPTGITYQANWRESADGLNQHARAQVKALAMTGLPIRLASFGTKSIIGDDLCEEAKELEYLSSISFSSTAIAIKQAIPSTPESFKRLLNPVGVVSQFMEEEQLARLWKSTIMYTSWERDLVHPEFAEIFSRLGQIWVPCEANKRAFVSSGLDENRIKVIPYPYDPTACEQAAPRKGLLPLYLEDSEGPKRFYSIGKWEPRKNQHMLIGAFLLAYTPKSKASLLIKTSDFRGAWGKHPTWEQSIAYWLSRPEVKTQGWTKEHFDRLVKVIPKKLSDEDIRMLHLKNNIYVSAGLGEAWDIPAFDAKLAGNKMVFVGFGGPEDYATSEDVRVPWDSFEKVHPGYLWEPDAKWASVKMEAFVSSLKQVKPFGYRMVPTDYARRFGMHVVANLMESAIRELAEELGCWEQLDTGGGFG